MNRLAAILMTFLLALPLRAAPPSPQKVAVAGDEQQRKSVEAVVAAGAQLIGTAFREPLTPPVATITVRFRPADKTAPPPAAALAPSPLDLEFPDNPPVMTATHRLLGRLLERRALEIQTAADKAGSLEWLAAALTHRLWEGGAAHAVPATFPGGGVPDLKGLLENPVPPDDPLLYPLYARSCDALLAVLESQQTAGESRILRIFELEAAGRAPSEAIRIVMLDHFAAKEQLQEWFRRSADQFKAGRPPAKLTLGGIQERIAVLDTALQASETPVSAPAPAGAPLTAVVGPGRQDVPFLPAAPESGRTAEAAVPAAPGMDAICGFYNTLVALRSSAPILLHAPLQEYVLAVDALRDGNRSRMRRLSAKARSEFADAVRRQQEITALLDGLEQETGLVVAGSELHQLALEIARESRLRRRALAPELNDWLDKLEQESAAVTP